MRLCQNLIFYHRFDPDDIFAPLVISNEEAYQLSLEHNLPCQYQFYCDLKSKSLLFKFPVPEFDYDEWYDRTYSEYDPWLGC